MSALVPIFQFDQEEALLRLPLPECWVVSNLRKFFLFLFFALVDVAHSTWSLTPSTFQVSKLHLLIDAVTISYDKFFFGDVGRETYDFFWGDFADWYVVHYELTCSLAITCSWDYVEATLWENNPSC